MVVTGNITYVYTVDPFMSIHAYEGGPNSGVVEKTSKQVESGKHMGCLRREKVPK